MEAAREELRRRRANVIYGTIRLIERDDETFLPWARDRYACVVFNLHVDHTHGAHRQRRRTRFGRSSTWPSPAAAASISPTTAGRGATRSRRAIRRCGVARAQTPSRSRRALPERVVPAPSAICSLSRRHDGLDRATRRSSGSSPSCSSAACSVRSSSCSSRRGGCRRWQQWQSGLLPYPVLLAGQAVVLWLMFSISIDYARGSGLLGRAASVARPGGGDLELLLRRRDGGALRHPDDATARPALARRNDSDRLPHDRRRISVDVR